MVVPQILPKRLPYCCIHHVRLMLLVPQQAAVGQQLG